MTNIDKNVLENYPGITLRFDPASKNISFFEGAKKGKIFPGTELSDSLSLDDLRKYVVQNQRVAVENATSTSLENGESWSIEYSVEIENRHVWLREQSYLTNDVDSNEVVVGLFIDEITASKQEKQQFLDELNKANESASDKNEFFASMSHEIRTPMNAVIGMAQILGKTALDVEQKQYVNTIMSSSNALVQIINDILDFSKIEAGKINLVLEEVDLEFLCLEICHLLSSRAQEKHLKIYLNYKVKDCKRVLLDKGRIRQILINLIGNAIKFTDTGYVELVVENSLIDDDSDRTINFKFSIKDSGIGISEAAKNNLFKAYAQADDSINQRFGGTGLGLKISQRLINLMGGNISLESTVGEGSNFWFVIPLEFTPDSEPENINQSSCLLIGDDLHGNNLIDEIIQSYEINIETVTSLDDAYKTISKSQKCDVFIVDNVWDEPEVLKIFRYIKSQRVHKNSVTIMQK